MLQAAIARAFGLENVCVQEAPEPVAAAGQVLVRIRACSLNYRDYLVAKGLYNPRMPLPRVLLSDGAGEVLTGGARWKSGDRVAGLFFASWLDGPYQAVYGNSARGGAIDGMAQEVVAVAEDSLIAIPEHLSFEQAATLPCAALTAWNALFETGSLKPGQTVLVQGSGGVSVFALQFAKAAGARVIATSASAAKRERLLALGAELVLDYKANPAWGKEVASLGGVDHVVEVGGVGSLEQSLIAVKAGGEISVIGVLSGISGQLNIAPILHKHLRLHGIYVGSRAMFENMNQALTAHKIEPVIDRVFALTEIEKALRYLESAGHFGKVVVRI
jgi:NADPH:quinone reductase-like Zn-dependent oxidoreductase